MKKLIEAYTAFTRSERVGVLVLLLLLLILLTARLLMQYAIPASGGDSAQAALRDKWEAQKQATPALAKPADTLININTADSVALVSLDGIGPKLAHRILERRMQMGSFKNYAQVWEVYHFSAETKKELQRKTVLR